MDGFFTNIESWLAELGVWAYVVAPLVMATVSILPIPAEAPAFANGMLFGPVFGSVVTWSGAMLGAWISYEIAQACGRPLALRIVKPAALEKVDDVAEAAGWWGLLVVRFVPVVAFTALNWGAGLSGVPRWRFLWTTALGIIPGAILFTSSGVGLGALYRRSPVWAAALAAAVLVGIAVWVVRRPREAVG